MAIKRGIQYVEDKKSENYAANEQVLARKRACNC